MTSYVYGLVYSLFTILPHVDNNSCWLIVDSQPQCTASVSSAVLPSDTVSLTCQVKVCSNSNNQLTLGQNGKDISTGNITTVVWTGQASNVMGSVTCSVTADMTADCPVINGVLTSGYFDS